MKIGSVSGGVPQDYPAQRVSEGAAPAQAVKASVKTEARTEVKAEAHKDGEEQSGRMEFSDEWMKKSIDQANKALVQHNRFIERQIHETTHTVMYTIKDTTTNEVIAEYPPKKIQDMIAKMWELAGLFVDEKA